MTTFALLSVKHAPGVTTAAVALAAASPQRAVVVEADPSGGDLRVRCRLSGEPGLLTLAAAGRHGAGDVDLRRHVQPLPAGGHVVVSPGDADLAAKTVAAVADRLVTPSEDSDLVVDCGRLDGGSPARAAVAAADLAVIVAEPTVAAVEHVRLALGRLRAINACLAVLLVGDRPYGAAEIEATVGVPVGGSIAIDPRGVSALHAGPQARKSLIVRSASTALGRLQLIAVTGPRAAVAP